ncbi:MAG: helix-turn-helix domain-containing protein [Kouleothrix sp.]
MAEDMPFHVRRNTNPSADISGLSSQFGGHVAQCLPFSSAFAESMQHLQQITLDSAPGISYGHSMKQVLNASEMARLLKVDRATITRWIKQGKFRGVQRPPGAQNWRIPIAAYEEFIKHRR